MKITIGLTKKAEALLQELVLGESTAVAAQQAELDEWREVAENRRQHALEAERKVGDASTRLRQAEFRAEGAETRLREAEAMLETVRRTAMNALETEPVDTLQGLVHFRQAGRAIIAVARK